MTYPKTHFTILSVGLLAFASIISVYAQPEKEIVSKFRKALLKTASESGENIQKIIRGSVVVAGREHGATIWYDKRGIQKMELTLRNNVFITFENDSIHWEYSSVSKQYEFEARSNEEVKKSKTRQMQFDFATTDLLNYKALNFDLRFTGVQKLDSVDVFALELKKPDQAVIHYYLNIKTNLLYKIVSKEGYRAFANYSVFDGYVFPTFMISKLDNAVEMGLLIREVTMNAEIPESVFMIPKEVSALMKKH